MAWLAVVLFMAGLFQTIPASDNCVDKSSSCPYLASIKECDLDAEYMRRVCPASCSLCLTTTTTTEVQVYQWYLSDWSTCSRECRWGTRVRNVYCVHWCSYYTSGLCPKKSDSKCLNFEERPTGSEDCYGPCVITATATTSSLTMTATTVSTQTITTTTISTVFSREYRCVSLANPSRCLAKAIANSFCGASCSCCIKKIDVGPVPISTGSWAPFPSTESASNSSSPDILIILGMAAGGAIIFALMVMWWISCINRAEKAKALRPYKATDAPASSPTSTKSTNRSFLSRFGFKKKKKTKNSGVIFDRTLGKGVASAPPEGYFEEEVFAKGDAAQMGQAFERVDGGGQSPSASPKNKRYVVIDGDYFTVPADQDIPSPSSPSKGRWRAGNFESPSGSQSASKFRGEQPESVPSSPNASKRRANGSETTSPVASKSRCFPSESTRSPSASSRRAPQFGARHHRHWHDEPDESDYSMSDDTDSSYSSADTKTSWAPRSPDGGRPKPPAENLPPGFAAASRASRRSGKEPPDPSKFHGSHEPPPMPGQANFENSDTPKGKSNRRGMATPPRANENSSDNPSVKKTQSFPSDRNAESDPHTSSAHGATSQGFSRDRNAGAAPGRSSTSGTTGASSSAGNHDPRTARNAEASSSASDLIALVDRELDQTRSKDLETRRKIFKDLMLHWHPDKNQKEALAAEVFRHLMSCRGRYLEA